MSFTASRAALLVVALIFCLSGCAGMVHDMIKESFTIQNRAGAVLAEKEDAAIEKGDTKTLALLDEMRTARDEACRYVQQAEVLHREHLKDFLYSIIIRVLLSLRGCESEASKIIGIPPGETSAGETLEPFEAR